MKIREIAKQSPLQEGAISNKVLPGLSFADAGIRVAEKDYPGAAIAGTAAGLSLIPTIPTQAASIGLEAFNQLRDEAARRGGWGNLGRDMMKSVRDGDFDHIHMLPEEFDKLDQLERAGKLDEGGLTSIPGWIAKYGDDAVRWLKTVGRRDKPDVPTSKPEVPDASVPSKKPYTRDEDLPIVGRDTPTPPPAATPVELPKQKRFESDKAYLNRLEKMGPEFVQKKTQMDQALISATQAKELAKSPFRRGVEKTAKIAGGTVLGGTGVGAGLYGATEFGPDIARKGIEWWRQGPEKDILKKAPEGELLSDIIKNVTQQPPADAPAPVTPEKKQELPPGIDPATGRAKDQGARLDDKEKTLTEKYQQFLNDDKKPQYTKEQFIQLAAKYAKQYDVPLPVVLHAMRKETGAYDANTAATVLGPKTKYGQAVGVMQLMPSFFKTLKPEDLTNPDRNIEAGTKFLANLYKTYGSAEAALAAYNAGPYNKKFKAWLKSNDPKDLPAQTREYLYGDPRKKTVGYVDDVAQQVALLNPPSTRDKVVKVATDVLAAATGSGDAQAANSKKSKAEVISGPQYPPHGTPIEKVQLPGHWTNPVLKPLDGRVHMQLQDLSGEFKAALDKAMADYAKDNPGVTITVTSGVRTPEDQKALAKRAAIEYEKMKRGEPNNYIPASKELAGHAGYAIDMNTPDLVKFSKWLRKNDPYDKKNPSNTKYGLQDGFEIADRVHLQLRGYEQLDSEKARRAYNKNLPIDKQILTAADWESYVQRTEAEKLALAQPKDKKLTDPGLGGAPEAQADTTSKADNSKPLKFPSIRSDIPSVDYQSQGDDTPAKSAEKKAEKPADKPADKDKSKAKTRVTTDATGRETTYTQNEKGQWVDPRGNIMPAPEKPGSRKDLDITDKGGDPSAADIEKSRNITGRKDPLIDPDTGFRTTEKALRDKLTQRAADEKAAAEREAKRIADLEKIQRDAEARKKAEKPADKEAGKADAGTGLAGTDTGKDKGKADKQQRAPAAPAAEVPAADAKDKSAKINVRKEFEKAFAAARAAQALKTGKGSGGTFTWTDPRTGKEGTFTTDYGDEVKDKKSVKVVPKAEPKADTGADTYWVDPRSAKIPYDVIRKQVKPDYTVDADPDAIKVPRATEPDTDTKLPSQTRSVSEPDRANVLRSTDGTPVTSGTGEPWSTGTSTKKDIERAKDELQKKIDDEKFKKELQKISPDLSEPEPGNRWIDKWNQGIEALTGKERMTPDDMNRIRVPESVNTELNDILWLAGRVKR